MSQIVTIKNGAITVDIDLFAERLCVSTKELKKSMELLALKYILNEAERLNSSEHFNKKTKTFPYPPMRDTHLIKAGKEMLDLATIESFE